MTDDTDPPDASEATDDPIRTARLWRDDGWTARVIKNEDDDGWAVAMIADGHAEPALIGPWTMGRDKKNPKPLDQAAFLALIKTAREFVRRSEQQLHATLHPSVDIDVGQERLTVRMDIDPDEDAPSATLTAVDALGEERARVPVSPGFRLTRKSAQAWAEGGFRRPAAG